MSGYSTRVAAWFKEDRKRMQGEEKGWIDLPAVAVCAFQVADGLHEGEDSGDGKKGGDYRETEEKLGWLWKLSMRKEMTVN